MAANGHAVVGGVDHVGVIQFAHRIELPQHPPDLDIDIFTAGKLSPDLVADGPFIAPLPYALYPYLVSHGGMPVVEGMRRQVIDGKPGLPGVGRRDGLRVGMIHRAVFG